MDTNKILGFQIIEDRGNGYALVRVVIGERIFDQELCGLPLDNEQALNQKLQTYVQDYAANLKPLPPEPVVETEEEIIEEENE